MTSINYQYLFKLDLLHDYFADQACTDFVITASQQTAEVLKGYKILTRQYENQLYAAIETDRSVPAADPPKPFIVPQPDVQFTFFLQLKNPLFFNYTDLPFSYLSDKIYYFTNKSNNAHDGKSFLHSNGYVSEDDALTWLPSVSAYQLRADTQTVAIEVSRFDSPPDNYTIVLTKSISFTNAVPSFTLDLSTLQAGKYKLKVNAEEQLIYLNDELSDTKVFAVIDIYNDSTLQNHYQLSDADNQLKSPLYAISFLNRSTIWKYVLLNENLNIIDPEYTYLDVGITEETGTYLFNASGLNTITSATPVPLSEKGLQLTLTVNTDHPANTWIYNKIACASPEQLTTIQPGPGDEIFACSEIFLNHYHIKPKT